MDCDWESVLEACPRWIRQPVDELGKKDLRELRLRLGRGPLLAFDGRTWEIPGSIAPEDLQFSVNAASQYSPWAAESMAKGYLTIRGGHRMGLCGETVVKNGCVVGFRTVTSLCLRVARDVRRDVDRNCEDWGSTLILGAPGWGKTTLLRSLARKLSERHQVAVVDERQELFPEGFSRGRGLDVLSGCGKAFGLDLVLRTLGPEYIALDEITAREDAASLAQAAGCGVRLLATAHASCREDLKRRPCYRRLVEEGIFDTLLILHPDKTYTRERMEL